MWCLLASVATGKKILHACADKAIPAIVELGMENQQV